MADEPKLIHLSKDQRAWDSNRDGAISADEMETLELKRPLETLDLVTLADQAENRDTMVQIYHDLLLRNPLVTTKIRLAFYDWEEKKASLQPILAPLQEPPSPFCGAIFQKADSFAGSFSADSSSEAAGLWDPYFYGTYFETVPANYGESLMKQYEGQVAARLHSAALSAARDKYGYGLLKTFLENGGEIRVGYTGRYHAFPLAIELPEKNSPTILLHELTHYFFGLQNTELSKIPNSGGADHSVITLMETRNEILENLRKGKFPSTPLLFKFGRGPDDWKDPQLQARLENGECFKYGVMEARAMWDSDWIWSEENGSPFGFSREMVEDMVHLYVVNVALKLESVRLALRIAKKKNISLKEACATAEFRKKGEQFARQFLTAVSMDPTVSLQATAREIMDRLLTAHP